VDEYWQETGKAGFKVWRYRLLKNDMVHFPALRPGAEPPKPTTRRQSITMRIVRNTELGRQVRELHGYTCQICGIRLDTPAGPYSEGAHVKPLGSPHNGPDVWENIICLCPNDHVLLDTGAIALSDELEVLGKPGVRLRTHPKHQPAVEYLRYHREHFGVLIPKSDLRTPK
jgi:putative restriction endonuclease